MAQARSKGTGKRGRPAGSKNSRGRKKSAPAHELPGGFWRQIVAILLALVAVFLILTWMGDGGAFLEAVDNTLIEWIGGARFLVPILLFWMAYKIFQSKNNQLAPVVWIASILLVIWAAGAFGLTSLDEPGVQNGGVVGDWLNLFVTELLDANVAIIIYIILMFVTMAFILQMNPAMVVEKIGDLFRTKEVEQKPKKKAETKKAESKKSKKQDDVEIEIHGDGVATEPEVKPAPKMGMFGRLGKKRDKEASSEVLVNEPEPEEKVVEKKQSGVLTIVNDPTWKMPSLELFERKQVKADAGDVQQNAKIIQQTLAGFGIDVEMGPANIGPRVTQYTMKTPQGVSLSKIVARDKELQLSLKVKSVRVEAPIPGTDMVGVEIPNKQTATVRLRGILESQEWKKASSPLTFALGRDISGKAVVADLGGMPHLIIAGTTGSGKSVMTNTMLCSLLYRNAPSDLKLIIVDPKQVEMVSYANIPHLLTPIINDADKAVSALRWAVNEMERRYTLMTENMVKNIADYNSLMTTKAEEAKKNGEKDMTPYARMPYIVILIDEMNDIMMQAGKELEPPIVRIAQKGRAAGLHLVLATQKPTVKVITGQIKANIGSRIAFAVSNNVDSRVILDTSGAEKLLGKGDMLFLTQDMMGKPKRVQGAWACEDDPKTHQKGDITKLTDFLRAQRPPEYNDEVVAQAVQMKGIGGVGLGGMGRKFDPNDPIVRKAVEITLRNGKFSTASLQTWLGKGHGFVSGLAIWLEEIGVIGPAQGHKPRDVLISSMEEFEEKAGV